MTLTELLLAMTLGELLRAWVMIAGVASVVALMIWVGLTRR